MRDRYAEMLLAEAVARRDLWDEVKRVKAGIDGTEPEPVETYYDIPTIRSAIGSLSWNDELRAFSEECLQARLSYDVSRMRQAHAKAWKIAQELFEKNCGRKTDPTLSDEQVKELLIVRRFLKDVDNIALKHREAEKRRQEMMAEAKRLSSLRNSERISQHFKDIERHLSEGNTALENSDFIAANVSIQAMNGLLLALDKHRHSFVGGESEQYDAIVKRVKDLTMDVAMAE
jgi:hypothetical protein